jgi:hypothetical protein
METTNNCPAGYRPAIHQTSRRTPRTRKPIPVNSRTSSVQMANNDERLAQKLLIVLCNVMGLIVLPVVGLYYFDLFGLIIGGTVGGFLYLGCRQQS